MAKLEERRLLSYAFTTIDYPNATGETEAYGINDGGQIVGLFRFNQSSTFHGFLKDSGGYHQIDYPGSFDTGAQGINDLGQIVGLFSPAGGGDSRGFLKDSSGYHPIDHHPVEGDVTDLVAINHAGQIVGMDGAHHSYLKDGESYADIAYPNAADTEASGINDAGQIVGAFYFTVGSGPSHGFLKSRGGYEQLDYPGAANTAASGINDAGQIVGTFTRPFPPDGHGFLKDSEGYKQIDYPDAISTGIQGINDAGQIVGTYLDTTHHFHGFLATPGSSDLAATQVSWNTTQGGVDFGYTISGADLPQSADLNLYWSADPTLDPDELNHYTLAYHTVTQTAQTGVNSPVTVHVGPADFLVKPPPGTKILVAAVNPPGSNHIAESDETNNAKDIQLPALPTVEVIAPDTANTKENYTVTIRVTNNDIETFNGTLKWTEQYVSTPEPTEPRKSSTIPITGLLPGQHKDFKLAEFNHSWQWLASAPPIKVDPSSLKSSLPSAGGEALGRILGEIAQGAARIVDAASSFADALINNLDFLQSVHSTANYTAVVDDGLRNTVSSKRVVLTVKPDKRNDYVTYFFDARQAAGLSTLAFEALAAHEVVAAIALATLECNKLVDAISAYRLAVDPPDSNYKQIASPEQFPLPEADSLPKGIWSDLARAARSYLAVKLAEETSIDRAQGAEAAGAADWQAAQLIAAAGFASEAASFQAQLMRIQSLLAPYITSVLAPHASDAFASLKKDGLPSWQVRYLAEAGWSGAAIENLRENFISLGPGALNDPQFSSTSLEATSLLDSAGAIDEITQGLAIRSHTLGIPVRDVGAADRRSLNAERSAILAGLDKGIPSTALQNAIGSYRSDVIRLLVATGNISALQADLDFGSAALIRFQQLDVTPAGIQALLGQLESSGKISRSGGDSLEPFITAAEKAIAQGRFDAASAALGNFLAQVSRLRGSSITASVADNLSAYGLLVRSGVSSTLTSSTPQSISAISNLVNPTYGQSLFFGAAVAAVPGIGTPTGTIHFVLDGSYFGPAIPIVNGAAISPSIATLGAGVHYAAAIYSGDANYAAIASPILTKIVAKAPLTIVASSVTKVYGRANPPIFAAGLGFVLGQGLANLAGVLSVATTATAGSHVGSYPVTPSGLTSANYAITYVRGTMAVTPAPLTIWANSATRAFGQPNPLLTASYAGFVNGDTAASLTTPVVLWAAANPFSPVGTYGIAAYGASSPDYAITFFNGSLAVTPPPAGATPITQEWTAFATTLYEEILGRNPDSGGLAFWVQMLNRRVPPVTVAFAIWNSPEHNLLLATNRAPRIALATALQDAQTAGQLAFGLASFPHGPLSLTGTSWPGWW